MAGRHSQAIEMAEQLVEMNNNFDLVCLMGEMKNDHTFFEKAWEMSKHRCSKAMRMLGRHYFYKKDLKKSIECYDKALEINRLYPDAWFAKGCAHMAMDEFKDGIFAFGTVISIDNRKVEAWANLANCYIKTEKFFEAVTCCEQALKCNKKAWKIWANYIIFAINTQQFYKAVNGINTLLHWDQLEIINGSLIFKVSDCFVKRFVDGELHPNDPDRNFAVNTNAKELLRHKAQLYKFYDRVTAKVNDFRIWQCVGRVKMVLQEPMSEIKELKMKELRAMMIINWKVDIDICKVVEKTLEDLVKNIFSKIDPTEEEKMYVRNTATVISDTLKRECTVKI